MESHCFSKLIFMLKCYIEAVIPGLITGLWTGKNFSNFMYKIYNNATLKDSSNCYFAMLMNNANLSVLPPSFLQALLKCAIIITLRGVTINTFLKVELLVTSDPRSIYHNEMKESSWFLGADTVNKLLYEYKNPKTTAVIFQLIVMETLIRLRLKRERRFQLILIPVKLAI